MSGDSGQESWGYGDIQIECRLAEEGGKGLADPLDRIIEMAAVVHYLVQGPGAIVTLKDGWSVFGTRSKRALPVLKLSVVLDSKVKLDNTMEHAGVLKRVVETGCY